MRTSSTYLNSMPPQAIHSTKKTKEWAEKTIDAIDGFSSNSSNITENRRINYNLVNNIFDTNDFKYVTDPFNLGLSKEKQGSRIRNINLIANKLNLLKGDELENPFEWTAMGLGGEIVNTVEDKRKELITKSVQELIRFELGLEETKDANGNIIPPEDPERVIENFYKSYKDIREINANNLLEILWENLDLKTKFNKGWSHALTGAAEVYFVGVEGGRETVRTVNTLNFDSDTSEEIDNIEDGDWAKEVRYLSIGAIIDEFGDELTTTQIKKLEKGEVGSGLPRGSVSPEIGYRPIEAKVKVTALGGGTSSSNLRTHRVLKVVWKTRKKIGFLRQTTPEGQIEEIIIDDTFKLSNEQK